MVKLKKINSEQENIFIPIDNSIFLDAAVFDFLKRSAKKNIKGTSRLLLHGNPDALLHQMIIVQPYGVYIRPHRNSNSAKGYGLIEGQLKVIVFDENKQIHSQKVLSLNDQPLFWMNKPMWHSLKILSSQVVYTETIMGPFRGTEYADWAPPTEAQQAGLDFMNNVVAK